MRLADSSRRRLKFKALCNWGRDLDFQQHFQQHYADLFRFAFRLLNGAAAGPCEAAEDAVQEAFLRLAREKRKELTGEAARRWLFVVVRNLCFSQLRRKQKELPLETGPEAVAQEPNPAQAASAEERSRWVEEAIAQLPLKMRETIILREYDGLDYAQIAQVSECSIGTVKSRLARGRQMLRARLRPLLEEEK